MREISCRVDEKGQRERRCQKRDNLEVDLQVRENLDEECKKETEETIPHYIIFFLSCKAKDLMAVIEQHKSDNKRNEFKERIKTPKPGRAIDEVYHNT